MGVSGERDKREQKLNYIHMNCSFRWNTLGQQRLPAIFLLLLPHGRIFVVNEASPMGLHLMLVGDFTCLPRGKMPECRTFTCGKVETENAKTRVVEEWQWHVVFMGNYKSEVSGCFKRTTGKTPKLGHFWQCISIISFFLYIDWAAIFCETITEINLLYFWNGLTIFRREGLHKKLFS